MWLCSSSNLQSVSTVFSTNYINYILPEIEQISTNIVFSKEHLFPHFQFHTLFLDGTRVAFNNSIIIRRSYTGPWCSPSDDVLSRKKTILDVALCQDVLILCQVSPDWVLTSEIDALNRRCVGSLCTWDHTKQCDLNWLVIHIALFCNKVVVLKVNKHNNKFHLNLCT